MRAIRVCALVAAALLSVPALAEPFAAFGPTTFEVLDEGNPPYVENFSAPQGGPYLLYLRNGDGEGTRVDDVQVWLNGNPVVAFGSIAESPEGLRRPVALVGGDNQLEVRVEGASGAFVTIAIGRPGEPPVFVYGRLVLAWGADGDEGTLLLQLKNGSPRFPRAARVVFYAPDGSVAAVSERIGLPPRASFSLPVEALIDRGDWTAGSIEVFYAGPGTARLFGTGTQVSVAAQQVETRPLEPAGARVYREPRDRRERGADATTR